jgi:predicted acetyltransferase
MWRIDSRERSLEVREWTPEDRPEVERVYREYARDNNGALDRGPMLWHRVEMAPPNRTERVRSFVVRGPGKKGSLEGYVLLNQVFVAGGKHEVYVTDLAATTPRAARRLWAFLASYATVGTDLYYYCGPTSPMLALLGEQPYHMELKYFWMLRVVDVAAALEARGYPIGYSSEFILEVTDPLIRKNTGALVVTIRDGRAATARVRGKTAAPRVAASINGLASLYAGFMSGRQCALAGLCSGDERALDLVSGAFAGTAAGMSDMF